MTGNEELRELNNSWLSGFDDELKNGWKQSAPITPDYHFDGREIKDNNGKVILCLPEEGLL